MGDDIYRVLRDRLLKSAQAVQAPSVAVTAAKAPQYRQGMTYGYGSGANAHGYAQKEYTQYSGSRGYGSSRSSASYAPYNGNRGYGIRYLTDRPDSHVQPVKRKAVTAEPKNTPKQTVDSGRKYTRNPNLTIDKLGLVESLENSGNPWLAAGINDAYTGLQRAGNTVIGGLTGAGMFLGKWLDPRSWGSSASALKNKKEWDNMRADRADMHADIDAALRKNYETMSDGDTLMKLHNFSNGVGSVALGAAAEMAAGGGIGRVAKGVSSLAGKALGGAPSIAGRMSGSIAGRVAGRVGAEATAFRSHFGTVGKAIDSAYKRAVSQGWKGSQEQFRLMYTRGINSPNVAIREQWARRLGLDPKFSGIGRTSGLVARDVARDAVRHSLAPFSPRSWKSGVVDNWRAGPINTWTGIAGKGKAVGDLFNKAIYTHNTVQGLHDAATGDFSGAAGAAAMPVLYGLGGPVGRYAGGGLLGKALRYGSMSLPWVV